MLDPLVGFRSAKFMGTWEKIILHAQKLLWGSAAARAAARAENPLGQGWMRSYALMLGFRYSASTGRV